ncbi:MAG: ACP S-malonyltransferase [Chloroflexi bacterium]|nr:ACP S-malonyltransferase [Chloroflexota bacterium]
MSLTAYVFPGQGAQRVGMGGDFFKVFPAARNIFERADEALGFSLSRLCFEGPSEELRLTINAQPAVMVVSLACLEAARTALADNLPAPSFVAGHSLGEYTALVAAGALTLEEGVCLVRERGRLMHEAGQAQPGSMLAAVGADMEPLAALCRESGAEIANINCPGQIVISGAKSDLERAVQIGQSVGIRKFIPLEVSGAFHSRLMRPAYDGLEKAVRRCNIRDITVPLVANVTASPVMDLEELRSELVGQICGCVQWQRSVQYMVDAGVSTFIEIGPGQVLSGLIRRTSKDVQTLNIGCCPDISGWLRTG